MADDLSFCELVRRVRARDEAAAVELVRRYGSAIRAAVRVRLSDPQLRRTLDSEDICQSVLGEFFERAAGGQFELERPEQLLGLLRIMARNTLTNEALRRRRARRDLRREQYGLAAQAATAAPGLTPDRQVEQEELLERLRGCLTPEEWEIAEGWSEGRGWADIAADVGGSADALRMRFRRTLDRVARTLAT